MTTSPCVASVNGVPLHLPHEVLPADTLRQRACVELLRQAAIARGLLDPADTVPPPKDGATSLAATQAIDALLDSELPLPEPTDDACRRYHAAHRRRFSVGERVRVRHVLFAVTRGVDPNALRERAEACLIDLRCTDAAQADSRFAQAAATLSNCPSGRDGGDLGWLARADCAPEFAREVFGSRETGVLPRLVPSRYGFHVIDVLAREAGAEPAFDTVREAVAQALRQQVYASAVHQYIAVLAGRAAIVGVDLEGAADPLVQ
jgi:peptidyl-prolyl cis-trans isomerase C